MTASPRRRLLYAALALVAADCLVRAFAGVWDRHSPDDYAARVDGCARRPRDLVFLGGSPVSEGIDPDRFVGTPWGSEPLADPYAVGLPGGTTTDIYFALKRACPTPPRVLVYGITASDLNDSRNEPHGVWSLMSAADVAECANVRPENKGWVIRQYARSKASQISATYHDRHGVRMWASSTAGVPTTEAVELRDYAAALRTGRGYAPAKGFENQRYDAVKESGSTLPPFTFLDRYKTGSHVRYLHKLIDRTTADGTKFVLVDMPVTADLEKTFPAAFDEYRRLLREIETSRGVTVIRAHRDTVGITEAGFADTIHLNRVGARVLSDWLRVRLSEAGREPVVRAQSGGGEP